MPKVRIEYSQDLLLELHEALDALRRTRRRGKRPTGAPHIERLIISLHNEERKVLLSLTPSPNDAA